MCLWRCWKRYSLLPSLFSFSGWAFWIKIACCFLFYTKRSRLGERGGVVALPTICQGGWDWVRFVPEYCEVYLSAGSNHLSLVFSLFRTSSFFEAEPKHLQQKICSVDCHTTKLQTPACWVWCEWGAIFPKSQWPNNKTAMTSIIFLIIIINPAFPIA